MTVKEAIEKLQQQPADAPVFFDCPYCFRDSSIGQVVMVNRVEVKATMPRK